VKVLLRAGFDVPLQNGAVADDTRIKATLPTIDFLRAKGAKIILISHLESIDGGNPSLEPVARRLTELGVPVMFIGKIRTAYDLIESGSAGSDCMLLENLRQFEGEKANDQKFAKELASLADIYVNDAFSVCHREHASIVGVPKFLPSYAGLQLEKEVSNLSRAFDPAHPFLFILGGAKFETKLPVIERFFDVADFIFVGGALANDFFKAKGYETGLSVLSKMDFDFKKFLGSPKLLLPVDVVTEKHGSKASNGLSADDKIADAGEGTMAMLEDKVNAARFILWNGPLGIYENGYKGPTLELAKMIGETTARGATTVVGGGDTLAAIDTLGTADKFTFISTGGGAMLDFLAKGTLPGIEALS
jgi:phosphoglycerate kinase